MAKQVIFSEESRNRIKKGMDIVAKSIRTTIGPFGKNAVIAKSYGSPDITNDGVTIAKNITLEDPYENIGAEIIKEVASKTNDLVGDGTSTSVVLVHALIEEGIKYINKGVNALSIRSGMEKASTIALKKLDEFKEVIDNDEKIVQVATLSAESEEIGKIIAETVKKVGKDGVITVEESQSIGIEAELVEGLEINKGFVSPYMMTNPDRMEAEYKDVAVLVTDKKISVVKEILPLLEKMTASGKKDLVIIADGVEGEALTTFVVNKLRGGFNVLAIDAPGYGDKKKELLEDIAVTIGAQVISSDKGMSFDKVELDMLGSAAKVLSKKDNTVLVGNADNKKTVSDRINLIKTQLAETTSSFDKDSLVERIAKLSSGVAVLKIGAATETEIKYLKFKIEDAVNATKAAIDEGIIPGGGATLAHIAKYMKDEEPKEWKDEYEKMGYKIVISALEAPLIQIVDNSLGEGEGVAVLRQVQAKGNTSKFNKSGYNAATNEFVDDMLAAGVIDPVRVTKSALRNSISSAAIFLTVESAITDIPSEKKDMPQSPMGGMY